MVDRRSAAPVASYAAMGFFWGAWAALLPEVKTVVGAADGPFGLALLAVGAGALPAMLIAGRVWGPSGRSLLIVTLVCFGFAALLPLVATTLPVLALALFLIGAASGALDVAMNADIADLEARTGRALMFGAHALFSLAVLVAAIATGLAREAGADRLLVLPVVAAAPLAVAVLAVATRERGTGAAPAPDPAESSDPATGRAPRPAAGWLLALGALCAGSFLIEDALQSWSALHLERTLGASPAVGGAGPGVFAAAMFLGRGTGQALSARASDRALVATGGIGTAVGMVLAAVAASPVVALVGFAVAGGSISLVAPALLARAARIAAPAARGSAISMLTTVGYLGFVVGPGAFGAVAGSTSLPVAFLAVAVLALALALSGFVGLREPERARVASVA